MWCSASCRAVQQIGLPLRCDTKCLTRHCLACHASTRSLIHHAPLAHRARAPPPSMLARCTTSWDLELARYEGHLVVSAFDYVLSERVRARFFRAGHRQLERGDESVLDGVGRAQFHRKARLSDPMASWSLFGRKRWLRSWWVPCRNVL